MADFPTRLDLFSLGAAAFARATQIDPEEVYVEGSNANLFVGATATVGAAILRQLLYKERAQFLDGAEGELLDRRAWDRERMLRKGASPALGGVRFYRASSALGAGSIAAGTKLASTPGAEYITTTTANFGSSSLVSTADVRAVVAGKAAQVGANQIRKFASGAPFDPSIKVNNDAPTAGGEDVEGDDLFADRVRGFWQAARRGVAGAIEFGALLVPGVTSARAIEALTFGGLPARVVSLYIADSSGVASDQLADQVRQQLEDYRAGGICVLVFPSLPQIVPVSLRLVFSANIDTRTLGEAVRAAVVEYVNSLSVNQPLGLADLLAVLKRFSSSGLIVSDDVNGPGSKILEPAGDVVPGPGQTLRTTPGDVDLAA